MAEKEPMVYMRVIETEGEKIVAICDEELLGKRFDEGDVVLYVDPKFYGGSLVPISVAIMEASDATIINMVGERIVQAAINAGLVHPQAVLRVGGVPHAQVIKMPW